MEMERDRRIAMERIAASLDIPVELLDTDVPCFRGDEGCPMGYGVGIVTAIGLMIEQYREMHRLGEDALLVVSLGREAVEILEQRGELLGGDDGKRRYVMVGEEKVEVQEDGWRVAGDNIIAGFIDGVSEGAKAQAPTTGPRHGAFVKRGKR